MKGKNIIGIFIVFIILFFLGLAFFIDYASKIVDQKIEKIKFEAQETIEGIKCEVNYKGLYYNGICTQELIDDIEELIVFDRQLELLHICMPNPYAYRYELCKEVLE